MDYLKNTQVSVNFQIDDFYSIPKIIATSFTKEAISKEKIIYQFDYQGILKDIAPEKFLSILTCEERALDSLIEVFNKYEINKIDVLPVRLHINSNTLLQTSSHKSNTKKDCNYFNIVILTTCKQYIDDVKKLCSQYIIKEADTAGDEIFLLKSDRNGVDLISIGTAKTKYVPENYSKQVQDKYNHLLEDLTNSDPCGRLNILSGEPGTGKTFLVKSLLSTDLNVSFVIVKPDAIESISDPSCIPALIKHHSQYDRPIIIVLEDADSCLSTRMGDNMSRLSAILNTSDGILGSTLDIRIIATTNAHKVDFDDAILRPGRLCTYINTDRLELEQASKIFSRETNGGDMNHDGAFATNTDRHQALGFGPRSKSNPGYVLAEIYKAAYTYNKSK